MSLLTGVKTQISPVDRDRATEASALIDSTDDPLLNLIAGAAGNSAHLHASILKEHSWLNQVLKDAPTDVMEQLLSSVEPLSVFDVTRDLRILKRRAALIIALYDLAGIWTLEQTTEALSRLAQAAIFVGLKTLILDEFEAGRLKHCSKEDLETDCGLFVLGMGKLGAGELNYSSDVDLIVLFDESRFEPEHYLDVRKSFVRIIQRLVKMLSENTADGYVFRTDLRLRPNPSVTPVCIATEPAEHYYESVGRTWERAAMIKARAIAGDMVAGEAFLTRLRPFVWRKYLDFPAIKDAQDMLTKIRAHKNLNGEPILEGHDIKLGKGGIREIEFFAQSHQLIFGGRDPSLRSAATVDALNALSAAGHIATNKAETLIAAYRKHRMLEHRIQILDDAQTHEVPAAPDKLEKVALLCGFENIERFRDDVLNRVETVFSATTPEEEAEEDAYLVDGQICDDVNDALTAVESRWFELPALRDARSKDLYRDLRSKLLINLSHSSEPKETLTRFEKFLASLPSGFQLFSLFAARPSLLDLVCDVCAVSPALAAFLGQNSSVLDAVLDRNFFEPFACLEEMKSALDAKLEPLEDYEEKLNVLRKWQKESHFRNGVHLLRSISTAMEVAAVYSKIAEISVASLLPHVETHLATRFGPAPGQGAAVLAMGKLGSREMTAQSDLDLIVIYDAGEALETEGPRQIAVGVYYSRFTQALIAGLTAPTAEGSLYEVDLRLRPSGRKGPVATSLKSFSYYQNNDAWTWEHLALTRARLIAGKPELLSTVKHEIDQVIMKPRVEAGVLSDILEMRARLADAWNETEESVLETKRGAGRLLDIELFLQAGVLMAGEAKARSAAEMLPVTLTSEWVTRDESRILGEIHSLLAQIQQVERLIGARIKRSAMSPRVEELLCKITGFPSISALIERIESLVANSKKILQSKYERIR